MQLELFRSANKPDLVSKDSIAHWSYMLATEGKRWPYLAPYYKAMLEFNQRRMVLGWDNAGPQPRHPHDDEDDDFGVLPVSRGFLARADGEWLWCCREVNQRSFDCWLPATGNY